MANIYVIICIKRKLPPPSSPEPGTELTSLGRISQKRSPPSLLSPHKQLPPSLPPQPAPRPNTLCKRYIRPPRRSERKNNSPKLRLHSRLLLPPRPLLLGSRRIRSRYHPPLPRERWSHKRDQELRSRRPGSTPGLCAL